MRTQESQSPKTNERADTLCCVYLLLALFLSLAITGARYRIPELWGPALALFAAVCLCLCYFTLRPTQAAQSALDSDAPTTKK